MKQKIISLLKNKWLWIGVAATAVIIAAVVASVMLWISSTEKPLKTHFERYLAKDPVGMAEAFPDKVIEEHLKKHELTETFYYSNLTALLERAESSLAMHDGFETLEILDNTAASKEKLQKLSNQYKDDYGLTVENARVLRVLVTRTRILHGEEVHSLFENDIYMVNIDGKWYMDVFSAKKSYFFHTLFTTIDNSWDGSLQNPLK